jgi:hypothetical protein
MDERKARRCDPLAIALTAAASARRSTTVQNQIWFAVPLIAAVVTRSSGTAAVGQNRSFVTGEFNLRQFTDMIGELRPPAADSARFKSRRGKAAGPSQQARPAGNESILSRQAI